MVEWVGVRARLTEMVTRNIFEGLIIEIKKPSPIWVTAILSVALNQCSLFNL